MASGDTRKVILKNKDNEYLIPYTEVASSTTVGRVKPDGTTTSVDANGTISVTGKQDTLVSGTNIKTINSTSLLGSGDIPFPTVDQAYSASSTNAQSGTAVAGAISGKQDTLVSGTSIKTINGNSILGSGDLTVATPVTTDNVTITKNTNDEIQTSGILNKNTNTGAVSPLGIWNGTETQWNQGEATTWYNWVNASASSSAKTLPSTGDWRNAIYDGTRMIVVSNSSSTFLYSTDGTNWSSGNIKISSPQCIAYGNNVWVAVPSSGTTGSRSTDGTSWSTITTPRGSTWIVYGNDKFVSTANGYFMYSADGLSWTDLGFIAGATYIAYGNGLFVTTGGSKSLYSNDGINWNTGTTSIGSFSHICYGANKFVALPFSDGNSIAYTTDGDTWTIVENAMPYTQSWGAITYGNGIFVATGYNTANAAYSYDGITWHGFSMPSSAKWFGAIYNGSDFYAFGYNSNKATKMTIGTWECFTIDENPTTSSVVYDAKSVVSTKTITSVGTGTITLSDSKTYSYNAGGNQFDYRTIGEAHPTWLCNINGVGVKIGNTLIATKDDPVAIDNSTITKNSSNQIRAVGTINMNGASGATNPKYDWIGTLQEHTDQQVETLHPNWICCITDDTSGGESVYTKSETDNLLSAKQATLVSGTNIKTINSGSILGSGDISVYTKSETDALISNINALTKIPQQALTYSASISLDTNKAYSLTLSGNVTFTLPSPTANVLNQIEVQLYMSTAYTVGLGTTLYFGGSAPDLSQAGYYSIMYEYDNLQGQWVVGALRKAAAQ